MASLKFRSGGKVAHVRVNMFGIGATGFLGAALIYHSTWLLAVAAVMMLGAIQESIADK